MKKTRKTRKPLQARVATQNEIAPQPEPDSLPVAPETLESLEEEPAQTSNEEPVEPAPSESEQGSEPRPPLEESNQAEPDQETLPRAPDVATVACGSDAPCACKSSRPKVPTAVMVQRHDGRLQKLEDRFDDLDSANRIILDRLLQLKSQVRATQVALILTVVLLAIADKFLS